MKAALLIILVVSGCLMATAFTLRVFGIIVPVADPIKAGLLAISAGIAGILPLMLSRESDPNTLIPRALMGTVLHVVIAAGLAIVLLVSHSGDDLRQLIFWVFGGYLISLLAVVWQSKRMLTAAIPMPDGNASIKTANVH